MATLFTKIINGEIAGKILHKDEHCAALVDIHPQAPQHILLVPRKEITSLASASIEDQMLLGHLLLTAANLARDLGVSKSGYRVVINVGPNGGQTVDHLHIHLLGGRTLTWPPG